LLRGAAQRARIASFDLVEFMPSRDVDGLGALVAGRILATMVGVILRQVAGRSG
jgi:agmatinase